MPVPPPAPPTVPRRARESSSKALSSADTYDTQTQREAQREIVTQEKEVDRQTDRQIVVSHATLFQSNNTRDACRRNTKYNRNNLHPKKKKTAPATGEAHLDRKAVHALVVIVVFAVFSAILSPVRIIPL